MNKDLSWDEKILYYGTCVATFGMAWILKVIIKKAIMEAIPEERIWEK